MPTIGGFYLTPSRFTALREGSPWTGFIGEDDACECCRSTQPHWHHGTFAYGAGKKAFPRAKHSSGCARACSPSVKFRVSGVEELESRADAAQNVLAASRGQVIA
jgi:hypothetical protein